MFNINYFNFFSNQNHIKSFKKISQIRKQEDYIFKKSLKNRSNILDWEIYDFEMLVELLTRFWDIDTRFLQNASYELMLSYNFLLKWHYNSSWKHLRVFWEQCIDFLFVWDKHWMPSKIKSIIEDVASEKTLYSRQIYIFYAYLSNKYTHFSSPFEQLSFDKNQLKILKNLIAVSIIILSQIIFLKYENIIESNWWEKIINSHPNEKDYYKTYISSLVYTYKPSLEHYFDPIKNYIKDKDSQIIETEKLYNFFS